MKVPLTREAAEVETKAHLWVLWALLLDVIGRTQHRWAACELAVAREELASAAAEEQD